MNLSDLSLQEIMEVGTIAAKAAMFDPKTKWSQIPDSKIQAYWEAFPQDDIETGNCALYLKPYIDYYGARFYWPILDVEHKNDHHKSIAKNIETAQNLYFSFETHNIATGLVISLTGQGFRFTLPYIVPYQYSEAFLHMIRDENRFPGIDPSPFKNGFLRMLGYRNNTRQNQSPKDVHIHTLDSAGEIINLNEDSYRRLVAGKPDLERCRLDLSRIIPKELAPPSLIELLDSYNFQILLGSTMGTPKAGGFIKTPSINMEQILNYADEAGYNPREHKWGEGIIYKLDQCPVCGESEGNPYITTYGKLKCHRATCSSGDGLSPFNWVEGYSTL